MTLLRPGKWNLLGGPDFRGARLRLGDGPEITGHVELHLHAADWSAHAHARDRAYDGVVLHVVLFPPPHGHVTIGAGGREIPVLALLPRLHHDLEEFAAEEAVETLAGRTDRRVPDELFALDPADLRARLRDCAAPHPAARVGGASHHTALEILGYRFNRAPMLHIASRWPLAEWARDAVDLGESFAAEAGAWRLQGVRPANHPRTRLRQYAAWTRAHPDWPTQLATMAATLSEDSSAAATREARRVHRFAALRKQFAALAGDAVDGTRLDNLIGDGFLPLLAAHTGCDPAAHALWSHWFPGDLPPRLARGLRELRVCGRSDSPMALGPAQGLLGWWIAHETQP